MQVNTEEFKKTIETTLRNHGVTPIRGNNSRGATYTIHTQESTVLIELGDQWVGYDCTINKSVFGREFGRAIDTDNYPLGGDYSQYTLDIFDETLKFLVDLLEGNIYIGKQDGKQILATPLRDNLFNVSIGGRFIVRSKEMTKDELMRTFAVRPVK